MALSFSKLSLGTASAHLDGSKQAGALGPPRRQHPTSIRLPAVKSCAQPSNGGQPKPSMQRGSKAQPPHKDGSYLARAECGAVECTSRGCRPVRGFLDSEESQEAQVPGNGYESPSDRSPAPPAEDTRYQSAAPLEMEEGGCQIEMWSLNSEGEGVFTLLPCADELLSSSQRQPHPTLSFSPDTVITESETLLELAEYTWRQMGDMARAEMLFEKALEEDSCNPTALASYALFLWELEAQQPEKCLI